MSIYGVIADLRREHPTAAAAQTLELVTTELGRTRDNLKDAVAAIPASSLPAGGRTVLDELVERARKEGLYDLDFGPDPYGAPPVEPLDEATAGIGALLGVTSFVGIALAVVAMLVGLNAILHFV